MKIRYKKLIALLTVMFSICNNSECKVDQEKNHDKQMQFVKYVQKRYYLVHRLERPMRVLFSLYENVAEKQLFNFWDLVTYHHPHHKPRETIIISEQFNDEVVQSYVRKFHESKDIKIVQQLWADFLSYKYIENDLFVRETIIVLIQLYRKLISSLIESTHQKNNDKYVYTHNKQPIHKSDIYDNFREVLTLLDEPYDEVNFIVNNNMRFYYIQRLAKPLIFLSSINQTLMQALLMNAKKKQLLIQSFKHEHIKITIEKMYSLNSIEPLLDLWHNFISYKFIDDTLLLQELLILLNLIYKNLIINNSPESAKTASLTSLQIMALYKEIADLPLPDLLNSLDAIFEQLILIIDKYELTGKMSWREWFKKYWWAPPIALLSVYVHFIWEKEDTKKLYGIMI